MIITAEFYDYYTFTKLTNYYFYMSVGDLGTVIGYTSEAK